MTAPPHRTPSGAGRRPDRPARARGARAGVLVLVATIAGCLPRPVVPVGVEPPPEPFERAPYVQAVGDDRAVILWRVADPRVSSSVRFRVGSATWRTAEIRRAGPRDRRAELRNLPADAPVQFLVEADGFELGPFRFHTAPADTSRQSVDVLAFGDSGWGSTAQIDLARLMGDRSWDLAVHVGDIAYLDGSEEDLTVRHFRVYRPLLARVPFFPSPGNHDVRPAGGHGAAYDRAFAWPGEARGGRFYTFRWGRAQFLALDTSTDSAMAELEERRGRQYRWLADTLEALGRDSTLAWTVVFTHRPLYSQAAGFGRNPPTEELREVLEPLFLEHGVDLFLGGHDHHYQRTHPMREGRVVDPGCGPVYVVTGGGGATRFARSVAPGSRTARVSRAYHFLDLSLGMQGGFGEAVGRDGEVLDRFPIARYEPGGETCDG